MLPFFICRRLQCGKLLIQEKHISNDFPLIFTTVFHRILDFKTGLDFYPGPFYFTIYPQLYSLYFELHRNG